MGSDAGKIGYDYFVVKTAMPLPLLRFWPKNGSKAERKIATNYAQTKRPKGCQKINICDDETFLENF